MRLATAKVFTCPTYLVGWRDPLEFFPNRGSAPSTLKLMSFLLPIWSVCAFVCTSFPKQVGERLQRAFELIDAIETRSEGWEVLEEVVQSIQGRFEMAGENVFDSMIVQGDVLKVLTEGNEIIIEGLNRNLLDKIVYYKGRSVFKSKMRAMAACGIDFEADNYQNLAAEFDMPAEDIKKIIGLIKNCFDTEGHFLKAVFDRNIHEFARYSPQIFAFLWQYLKQPLERKDRVAYLNSLQILTARMNSAKNAIRVLFADLCHEPADVDFSDRNAPMFACMLLRKFNQEMNLDIEITPEEVLRVNDGLDPDAVACAAEIIESNPEIFLEKIQTIGRKIIEALRHGESDPEPMPLRYLLSLEREIHILLSLVGGETAVSVLRNAVKRYGNPASELYRFEESSQHVAAFLQHLKVAIRGLARIGEKIDLAVLGDVKKRRTAFLRLAESPKHKALVKRVMEWVDISRQTIFPNAALNLPQLSEDNFWNNDSVKKAAPRIFIAAECESGIRVQPLFRFW
jgi:hypothetical protein